MEISNYDKVTKLIGELKESPNEESTEIIENITKIVENSAMKALLKSQTVGNEYYAKKLGIIEGVHMQERPVITKFK